MVDPDRIRSAQLDKSQRDALDALEEDDVVDNQSEALRMTVEIGLVELGYLADGRDADSRLAWLAGELARVFAYLGLGWLAATLYFPVGFRLYAVGWFLVALVFVGIERLLSAYEPAISNRLRALTTASRNSGGERAS